MTLSLAANILSLILSASLQNASVALVREFSNRFLATSYSSAEWILHSLIARESSNTSFMISDPTSLGNALDASPMSPRVPYTLQDLFAQTLLY